MFQNYKEICEVCEQMEMVEMNNWVPILSPVA